MTRDWAGEERFADAWRPNHKSRLLPRLSDARRKLEAETEDSTLRQARTGLSTISEDARPEKRGGAREGGGRPKGSYFASWLLVILEELKAAVKFGNLEHVHMASRDLPAAMFEAKSDLSKTKRGRSVFPQTNDKPGQEICSSQDEMGEVPARTEHWEHAVGNVRAVEEECLGASSVHSVGLEVSAASTAVHTPLVYHNMICMRISLSGCLRISYTLLYAAAVLLLLYCRCRCCCIAAVQLLL